MKSIAYSLLVLSLASLASCGGNGSTENTPSRPDNGPEEAEERNEAKFNSNSEKDAQFVVDAAEISLTETGLGKLASGSGMTKEVRELGDNLSGSHRKVYDELSAIAKRKNISVPLVMSKESQEKYNSLSDKKGSDFDKNICDALVKEQKNAIDKFDKASRESTDPDIQAWAANMLPSLRSQLDLSMSCQERVAKLDKPD